MSESKKYFRVLTIAGSDSGGGAGIQADLKTFSALDCYGMSVITALTAQNTKEVRSIFGVPATFVRDQLEAVLSDIGVDAVKIGMLGNSETIKTVSEVLQRFAIEKIVLDPVMVAKSGDRLLQPSAIEALKMHLLPLATIITPNIPEAESLLGRAITSQGEMEQAAKDLIQTGAKAVLLKGGHLDGVDSPDCMALHCGLNVEVRWYRGPRIKTRNTHGTGCTLSSAVAAYLARGSTLVHAVDQAKKYLSSALESGARYSLGGGHGPVDHSYFLHRGSDT